jgi:hypothetical protein
MTMASRNAMRAIGQLVRRSKVRLAPKAVEVKPAEAAAAGAKPPCVFSTEAFGTSAEAFVPPFDLDLCRSEVRVNVGTAGRTPKQVRASSDMDWPLLGAEIERVDSDSPAAAEEGCQKEVRGLFEFYLRRADARGCAWRRELRNCGVRVQPRELAAGHSKRSSAATALAEAAAGCVAAGQSAFVFSDSLQRWVKGVIDSVDGHYATVHYEGRVRRVDLLLPSEVRLLHG